MQDTGTGGHRFGDAALDWHVAIDGDGKRVAVDPADPQTVYAFANEFFARSKNGGGAWQLSLDTPRVVGIGLPNNKGVTLRLALNPNGANPAQRVIYVTQGSNLFRSTDGGVNFAEVTPKVPFRRHRSLHRRQPANLGRRAVPDQAWRQRSHQRDRHRPQSH